MNTARRFIRRSMAVGCIVAAFLLPISFPRPSPPQRVAISHNGGYVSIHEVSPQEIFTVRAERRSAEALDLLLRQDPDVKALLEITEEMTRRAISRGVSPVALKTAYEMGDEEKVRRMIGYSQAEIMIVNYRLDRARRAILEKFPEIAQLVKEQWSTSCALNPSLYRCSAEKFFDRLSEELIIEEGEVTCDWGPYVAALAACTLAGPLWYWVCAYVALCSFCRGGWVDRVCTR